MCYIFEQKALTVQFIIKSNLQRKRKSIFFITNKEDNLQTFWQVIIIFGIFTNTY